MPSNGRDAVRTLNASFEAARAGSNGFRPSWQIFPSKCICLAPAAERRDMKLPTNYALQDGVALRMAGLSHEEAPITRSQRQQHNRCRSPATCQTQPQPSTHSVCTQCRTPAACSGGNGAAASARTLGSWTWSQRQRLWRSTGGLLGCPEALAAGMTLSGHAPGGV